MVEYEGRSLQVRCFTVGRLLFLTLRHSDLLVASENLHWPMPVDYAAASPEHRNAFETSFRSLLDFQAV